MDFSDFTYYVFIVLFFISIPSNYDEDVRDSIGSALATKLIIPFCQGDIPKSKYEVNNLGFDYIIIFV